MSEALDKAIRAVDASSQADFQEAIRLLNKVESITKKYGRKIDSSAIYNYIDAIRKQFEHYEKNASKGWYD